MAPTRAVCVTSSVALRRTLRRAFHATGTQVEFADAVGGADPADAVVVIDQPTYAGLADADRATLERGRALIVMGASLEDEAVLDAMRRERWNHVIREAEDPDDDELVVTSVKLSSGDIFGLEKYLAWGVKVNETTIDTYEAKREALLAVTASARDGGARRPTIARIESVVDELLMNAMYDAPAVATGKAVPTPRRITDPVGDAEARLRWAADGRYFAVSVEDRYGARQGRHPRPPAARPPGARAAARPRRPRRQRRRRPRPLLHPVVGDALHRQPRSRRPHRGHLPVRPQAGRPRRRRLRPLAARLRSARVRDPHARAPAGGCRGQRPRRPSSAPAVAAIAVVTAAASGRADRAAAIAAGAARNRTTQVAT